METMLFIRKPMETYRNQSQNFMGIKLIHVWYIPTVWGFWELSTGVLWESSLSMYGPKQSMGLVYFETGSGKGLHFLQRKLCLSQRYVGGSMPNQQACKHEETAWNAQSHTRKILSGDEAEKNSTRRNPSSIR